MLEDACLDLVETVMIFVEDLLGVRKIQTVGRCVLPGQLQEQLEIEVRSAQKEAERHGTLVTSSIDFPQDVTTMFEDVFEEMPWHLREQQAQMVAELEAKRK